MASAEYYREWRKNHPEYRKREAVRSALSKKTEAYKVKARETARRNRKSRAIILPEIPMLHTGHELFEQAWKIMPIRDGLTTLSDPQYDDMRSEIVLAILEGRDPVESLKAYRSIESAWARITCELLILNCAS